MDQIIWQRRSESDWREIVARQEQSGQTVQDFCEREGLNAASLYGWRVRLRQEPSGKKATPKVSRSARSEESPGEFIDLGAIDASRSRFEVRLDLGGGVLLHLVRG